MIIKTRWANYFLKISPIYFVAFVFYPHCRIDGLSNNLSTYYENLELDIDIIKKKREIKELVINL